MPARVPRSLRGAPTGRPRPRRRAARSGRAARLAWAAAFAVVGAGLFWVLRPVLGLLAASAAIAYLLDPIVDAFERRRMSREAGIVVIYTTVVAGLVLGALLLVPAFSAQFEEVAARIGPFFRHLDDHLAPALAWLSERTGREVRLDLSLVQERAPAWVAEQWPDVQAHALAVVNGLFTQGVGLVSAILNLLLTPIFVFYLLRDWDRLVAFVRDLVPLRHRPRVERVAQEVDARLGAFVRGQITVSLLLAVLYSAGLLLVGIDLAVPVGVLAGLLFIVPYLGTAVGIALGVLLALVKFGFAWKVLWVLVVFGVVQGIEGYFLTPRIVGEKVGLHPLVVIVALIAGGALMGIWGMLLAIPVTAVLSVLAEEWLEAYRESGTYRG